MTDKLDLEQQMKDAQDQRLNEDLAKLQQKYRVTLHAAQVVNPLTGIVENKIIKVPMPDKAIETDTKKKVEEKKAK